MMIVVSVNEWRFDGLMRDGNGEEEHDTPSGVRGKTAVSNVASSCSPDLAGRHSVLTCLRGPDPHSRMM